MIRHYYYNRQLRRFIIAFANVFTGMIVKTGKGADGTVSDIEVPVAYGSRDRVVAMLASAYTQNKPHTLPMMSCYMIGLNLAPERLHGVNMTDTRKFMEQGGVYPDDLKAIQRVMPVPYNMQMELALYSSNTDQLQQMLEQSLILFDYDLQLQFSDAPFDWSRLSKITLMGLNNEENYPSGLDRRAIIWSLNFDMPIWLSPPIEVRNEIISSINIRFGDLDELTLNEVDGEGNLVPFETPLSETPPPPLPTAEPADPGNVEPPVPGGGA